MVVSDNLYKKIKINVFQLISFAPETRTIYFLYNLSIYNLFIHYPSGYRWWCLTTCTCPRSPLCGGSCCRGGRGPSSSATRVSASTKRRSSQPPSTVSKYGIILNLSIFCYERKKKIEKEKNYIYYFSIKRRTKKYTGQTVNLHTERKPIKSNPIQIEFID